MNERVKFDPSNKKHVQIYKQFLISNSWKSGCPFKLEAPWISVPDMIKDRLIRKLLKV